MNGHWGTQEMNQFIERQKILILMGFLVFVFGYVIIRGGINLKITLLSIAFLSGMVFLIKDFVRALFHREVVICFLVAYLPFSKQIPVDFGNVMTGLNLTNLLVGFLTLLWLTDKKRRFESTHLNLPIFIFAALGLFSLFRGASYGAGYLAEAGIQLYRSWLLPLYLYFLIFNLVKEKKVIENMLMIMMMVTTMIALMSIYEYMDTDKRVGGVFDQPNQLAAFFVYYSFFYLAYFLRNMNRLQYWAFLIPFLLCFRGIMVTFSRAGYLAFAVGLYAITCARSKWMLFLLALATALAILNPALLPEGIRYRLGQTIEKRATRSDQVQVGERAFDQNTSDRLKVWNGALAMIQAHPVSGIGYDLFQSQILHYYPGAKPYNPHNTYLLIAAEMGIGALTVFLWILWRIFRNASALYRTTQDPWTKTLALGFLGGFFGLLASNMFGLRLHYPEVASYFWILCALIMRLKIQESGT